MNNIATPYCVVLCTCPTLEVAQSISTAIIDARLAACTNIVPHINAIFRWEDKVEQIAEAQIMIKTRLDKLEKLEKLVFSLHPYTVPEWIAFPVVAGSKDYCDWIDASVA